MCKIPRSSVICGIHEGGTCLRSNTLCSQIKSFISRVKIVQGLSCKVNRTIGTSTPGEYADVSEVY